MRAFVLAEDCQTSLTLQKKFNNPKAMNIGYWDITIRTGDNCAKILRQLVHRTSTPDVVNLFDKVESCNGFYQSIINGNGGLLAMPLPAHLKEKAKNYKIDSESCPEIVSRYKITRGNN